MGEYPASPTSLFVYGTLQPGEPRWCYLEPYVVGDGIADTVAGRLYDTGLGYPAAVFARGTVDRQIDGIADGLVMGHRYQLRSELLAEAWAKLDEVEAAVIGAYRRVSVAPTSGRPVQAYEFGLDAASCSDEGVALMSIESGSWAQWCAQISR